MHRRNARRHGSTASARSSATIPSAGARSHPTPTITLATYGPTAGERPTARRSERGGPTPWPAPPVTSAVARIAMISTCLRPVRHRPLRFEQRRKDAVCKSDITKHRLRDVPANGPAGKVVIEDRLAADEHPRITTLFPDTRDHGAPIRPKVDRKFHESYRARDFLDANDRANTEIDLLCDAHRDLGFLFLGPKRDTAAQRIENSSN